MKKIGQIMKKTILAVATATIAIVVVAVKSDLACQYSPVDISWVNNCETVLVDDTVSENNTVENVTVNNETAVETTPAEAEIPVVAVDPNVEFIPTFDIARVEPDGSTLVAGRGAPKSKIILLNDGENIGETVSNGNGEWVIIVDKPITAATASLSLVGFLPNGTPIESKASLTIALRNDEPAKTDNADVKDSVANAANVTTGVDSVIKVIVDKTTDTANTVADNAKEVANETTEVAVTMADKTTDAVAATVADAIETVVDVIETTEDKTTDIVTAATETASDAIKAKTDEIANTQENITDTKPVTNLDAPLVVLTEKGKPSKILQGAGVGAKNNEMTFNSLDYNDKGEIIFSGDAKPNEIVRVYVNDEFVGEAKSNADGRWALNDGYIMQPGANEMRFDQVDDDGKVIARRVTNITMPKLSQPVLETASLTKEPSDAGDTNTPAEDATPNAGDDNNTVQKPKTGRAVIVWGDSLWNISQKIYGKGELYTTIFKANQSQILNPDLIYPGQVFILPDDIKVE